MGWAQEVSGSKFAVNLLSLLPFPLCVHSWDLWWKMFRARDLGLGFRLGVGQQRTTYLPPLRAAEHVCTHTCVFMHCPCSITSQECVVDKVFRKTTAALKRLCTQSTRPALLTLEVCDGGQPIAWCRTGTSLTGGPLPPSNPFPITGPLTQVLVASMTGPSVAGEFLQRVSGTWRTCLGYPTLPLPQVQCAGP